MSGDAHDAHGASHAESHEAQDAYHGTFKGYLTGFVLAVVLTAIPFWLVMGRAITHPGIAAMAILAIGAVQIVVHMVYFLHMDTQSEAGWNMLALIFTAVLVIITLSGSLWVMYHLNHNMMPMPAPAARALP